MGEVHTPPTLIAALQALEEGSFPGDFSTGLGVYDRRAKDVDYCDYADLVRRARARGAWLKEQGVEPGHVVYVCLPTGHEMIEVFLGAVVIQALPCCVALPRALGGLEVFKRRLALLAERYPGGQLITDAETGAECGIPSLQLPALDPAALDPSRLAPLRPVEPSQLAYVQLTSGSTSLPKAVAISHGNLCANARAILLACGGSRADTFVSWLPLYHDMGLVGMLFTALIHGVGVRLMRPETFVGSPLRWLGAIAEQERSVVTTAPNFGYQWCVDRIRADKVAGLDLSGWRVAACGAEMIRPLTLSSFLERFQPAGLRPDVFIPCYGMAETTLALASRALHAEIKTHQGRVSCGQAVEGMELEIRDPETWEVLGEGREGEIVCWGSSLFQGYHLDPESTAENVRDGRLRTGDLGYLHEGELYVTGRLKDVIIFDGANVAPYELEWIAEQHVDMDGGRAAAFSVDPEGREVPVLLVEAKSVPSPEVIAAVKAQVAAEVAPLYDLVIVRRGCLPKTTSGKVMRGQSKALYLQGELDVLWQLRDAAPSA